MKLDYTALFTLHLQLNRFHKQSQAVIDKIKKGLLDKEKRKELNIMWCAEKLC